MACAKYFVHAWLQDLVIPNLKHPAYIVDHSPLAGNPPRERDILFLFRGLAPGSLNL
jgi:hypothetical protein